VTKEVAVGTVSQETHHRNSDRQPRWDRCERADRFAQYRALRAQGLSQRQVAQALQVPRTTLQAWRTWHDSLAICPHVAEFFQSGPGLAFVHRLVVGFHLVCVAVGACGMRLAGLFLTLTGLDRFGAASYGAQQQGNCQVEAALVAYRRTDTARLATDMPRKDLTVTQDEPFPGGRCLVGSEPVSHFMLLEQLAQRRDQAAWQALLAPALAQRNCHVMQSTSDEAPGLLASVAPHLEAHHSPDVFHVQPALSKAVCAPMAAVYRQHAANDSGLPQVSQRACTHPLSPVPMRCFSPHVALRGAV
jgi:DNA-binding XRE family transcriptional regulator